PPRPMRGPAVRPTITPGAPPPMQSPHQPRPLPYGQRPGAFGRQQGGRPGGGRFGDRQQHKGGRKGYGAPAPVAVAPTVELKDLEIPDHISVMELAGKLGISPTEIIKTLMSQGLLVTINQTITFDKAQQIAVSHGFNAVLTEEHEEVTQESEKEEDLVTRPPVVTVLGHVDHGKTSLLDAIRNTNVTAGEAGGITQSIGAYSVDHNGRFITFIDTPGHEAFTAMRARGAKVTDVAVLVVAADDGIMPQTIEAINHAKAAKVPIVVAINKIDKPNANVDRVKQQLTEHELVPEDWGGTTICQPISAKQKTGIDDLLEMILLVTEMAELKANPLRKAQGIIIEAKIDKGLGPVATVLVQTGTLKVNDAVVVGPAWGKVRALINDHQKRIGKVSPGMAAEIIGLNTVPASGDLLQVVDDAKMAQNIAEQRELRVREKGSASAMPRTSLDDLFNRMQAGEVKDLNLIVKADNQGSVEALKHSLLRLTTDEVKVNVVHGGVGTITESDILLATASSAIVIGFNVRPDPNVKKLAEQEGVDIRSYRVIYHLIEDIQAALKGMLAPEFEEVALGRVEVREIFTFSKIGTIAGCYVTEGKVIRNCDVRVLRDGVVAFEGKIDSLKRFKDDAKEVAAGYECGISIERFPNFQKGDIIEAYKMEEKARD
ncbi:MAG: translation initiation factor IF-2, partial [Proteobacteria bacterium]|nr:translation initiation factor IF-2 [Pseudomonadota bacterium]